MSSKTQQLIETAVLLFYSNAYGQLAYLFSEMRPAMVEDGKSKTYQVAVSHVETTSSIVDRNKLELADSILSAIRFCKGD